MYKYKQIVYKYALNIQITRNFASFSIKFMNNYEKRLILFCK